MTKMQRDMILSALVANCSCEATKQTYPTLSDEALADTFNEVFTEAGGNEDDQTTDDEQDDEEEPTPATNRVQRPAKATTLSEWEASMPPEARSVWNSAKQVEHRERKAIVDRLVVNVTNPDKRKTLVDNLMRKPMTELLELLAIAAPAPVRRVAVPEPIYTGANVGDAIAANAGADDDVLPLPTMSSMGDEK